ncbi:unnamed protein product [Phaedon cochleariae]|uniref:Uncharacterized protein n=1 Tax=Phaedon cochleariae TaxID=80249 RepID=A0A9N9SEV7_PHACE|nr:unnamed protein product [Phaedon cochleariae]
MNPPDRPDVTPPSKIKHATRSPVCLPDIPLPAPPPMANIMMTSRFDLQTLGGFGYRRILSTTRGSEYERSPVLSRCTAPVHHQGEHALSYEEASPEYQSVFYNDHYMSDIDENEEIKEFLCGYNAPERRHSDHSEKQLPSGCAGNFNFNTLPHPGFRSVGQRSFGSNSSMKSSDYYVCSPLPVRKAEAGGSVFKSPQRTIEGILREMKRAEESFDCRGLNYSIRESFLRS